MAEARRATWTRGAPSGWDESVTIDTATDVFEQHRPRIACVYAVRNPDKLGAVAP
jgi:phage-related minor tail protein